MRPASPRTVRAGQVGGELIARVAHASTYRDTGAAGGLFAVRGCLVGGWHTLSAGSLNLLLCGPQALLQAPDRCMP